MKSKANNNLISRCILSLLFAQIIMLTSYSNLIAGDATSLDPTAVAVKAEGIGGSPVGSIMAWNNLKIPDGWLECNGQSTKDYPKLAAITGPNVPDLRGEFIRGWDHGKGTDKDRSLGTPQNDSLRAHNHIQGLPETNVRNPTRHTRYGYTSGPMHGGVGDDESRVSNRWFYTSTTGGDETRPRNVAMIYIIRAE